MNLRNCDSFMVIFIYASILVKIILSALFIVYVSYPTIFWKFMNIDDSFKEINIFTAIINLPL